MNPPGWLVDRLPEWARSIRFRYTLLYSAVLFGLAAVVVAAIYLVLMMSLRGEPVSPTYSKRVCSLDGRCATIDYFQAREFALLRHFMSRSGQVLSQEELLEHVWDENADPFTNTVRVTVMTLRRKLAETGDSQPIETVVGRGYRLREQS